jgi:hypothetical protein
MVSAEATFAGNLTYTSTCDDVSAWLAERGVTQEVINAVHNNEIDGRRLVSDLLVRSRVLQSVLKLLAKEDHLIPMGKLVASLDWRS